MLPSTNGSLACQCPPGMAMVTVGGFSSCQNCTPGTYSSSAGNELCTSCASHWDDVVRSGGPEGAISPDQCVCHGAEDGLSPLQAADGTTKCLCAPGAEMIVQGDDPICRACEAGKFSTAASNVPCIDCVSHWQDSYRSGGPPGSSSADQCACGDGTELQWVNGSFKCRCPLGQALTDVDGVTSCVHCAVGSFSDVVGNELCVRCSTYFEDVFRDHTAAAGATSPDNCTCRPTFVLGQAHSSNDGHGAAQSGELSSRVQCHCPENSEISADGSTCQLCPEGEVSGLEDLTCYRPSDAAPSWLYPVAYTCGGLVGLALLAGAAIGLWRLYCLWASARKAAAEQQKALEARLLRCVEMMCDLYHPVVFIRFSTFRSLGALRPHEELLAANCLHHCHTYAELVPFVKQYATVFFSHQVCTIS